MNDSAGTGFDSLEINMPSFNFFLLYEYISICSHIASDALSNIYLLLFASLFRFNYGRSLRLLLYIYICII